MIETMNIALPDLYGKRLALLLWFLDEEMETTAAVVSGIAFQSEGFLCLHRGSILPPFRIPLHLVWRATLVPPEVSDILGTADYCIQADMSEMELGKAS